MKKLLLFIFVLMCFFSQAQVLQKENTYGREVKRVLVNTSFGFPKDTFAVPVNYQNDQWWAAKEGSLYRWDTVSYTWKIYGQPTQACPANGVLNGSASVTWQGSGYNFSVAPGLYMIDCNAYTSDSGTVTLSASDPDFDRFDVVYVGTDGAFHVLEGEPSASAAVPQVQGDEIALTAILVRAASTAFEPNEQIIYDENTESIVSNTGTTTNGANATNVFRGTLSTNVTNINNGDIIYFTKAPVPATWDITGIDILSLHIKLKAVMPTLANLRVQFYNGTTSSVSAEVAIPLDRNNTTTYQALSIPMSAFGNITTTQFTRVRFRYTSNNASNYTGFYLDYLSFVDNLPTLPPTGAQVNLTLQSNGPAITIYPSTQIQNGGTWTLIGGGNSNQYVTGSLTLQTFPTLLSQMGAVDGRAKNSQGGAIDGTTFYQQLADDTYPGLLSPALYTKINRNDSITNGSPGDTLLVKVNDTLLLVKSLIAGPGITLTPGADSIVISASASASRFGVSGEDDTGAENRLYTFNSSVYSLEIKGDGSTDESLIWAPQSLKLKTTNGSDDAYVEAASGSVINLHSSQGTYYIDNLSDDITATKALVWNTGSNQIGTVDISSLGTTETASSGLSKTGNDIQLGGSALSANTSISTSAFTFDWNGSSSNHVLKLNNSGSGYGLSSISSSGDGIFSQGGNIGVVGYSPSGTGVQAASDSGLPLEIFRNTSTTNSVVRLTSILTQSTGTAANGLGGSVDYRISTSNGTDQLSNQLISKWTTATTATRTSQFDITGVNSASTETYANFQTGGIVRVNNLADTLATKAYARSVGGGGGSGANTALSNLASVAINTSLVSDADNTDDLGSAANGWKDIYSRTLKLDGSTSGTVTINSDALANSLNATTLSGAGYVGSTMWARETSDFTGSNTNTAQNVFSSSNDVWTLQGSTTYYFEGVYYFAHGTTSHTVALSFALGGGASVTSILYDAMTWTTTPGTTATAQYTISVNTVNSTVINNAGTFAAEYIRFSGHISMNAGGTVTPQYTFSVDPTGTILTKAGSYIKFTPIGTNTVTTLGNVN